MDKRQPGNGDGLRAELQEAYDTYKFFSFYEEPPKHPFLDHWKATGKRAGRVFFGMPLLPVALFRIRNFFLDRNVPLLPYVCDLLSIGLWHVSIGRHTTIGPGLIIPHGHVIIDGNVAIGRDCTLNPWVTIGLSGSRRWGLDWRGPIIGDGVFVGSGAKLLGPITVGDNARIGANAVVLTDVPAGATVVGAPARVAHRAQPVWPVGAEAAAE